MSSRSEAPPAPSTSEQRDWRRLGAARSLEEFSSAWLALAGAALGAERGVLVARRPGSERFAPVAFLPHGEPCGTFLADAAERALYDAKPLAVQDGARLGIAYPVLAGNAVGAIAAFEWPRAPQVPPETLMRRVQWGLGWVEARLAAPAERATARDERGAGALRRALEASSAEDAARGAATELAHGFGLDRVAAGFLADGKATLAALSHTAQFDPHLAMPRALAAAIEEAARQGGEAVQAADGRYALVLGTVGFSFERAAGFDDALRAELRAACALLAPALALQHAAAMPLHRRAAHSTAAGLRHWFGAGAGRRRVLAALALTALVGLFFVEAEFRVAGDATLEGAVRRVMSAPFDGYVLSSSARAGDVVKQGAPIAALDDRDLRLERVRSASQHTQYARQIQEASARHERGQMQILQAQAAQAEAQMRLLDEQIRRANLTAPFDGLIVSGDLSQSVGSAVRKGDALFEIAPLTGYRVVVQVDETEISALKAGQKGTLLLAAITEETFPITVTSVTPVARAVEGRNAFRVEASLDAPGARLRPGMEGVAKIETGSRNLVWIWTHRFTNWARLKIWSLWP